MTLLFVLVVFLQVGQIESIPEVSGYVGETVTLPCHANPSWNLSKIEWSVFSNNTWIATFRKGNRNTEWVSRYNGRLTLNTTSGDLIIHNVSLADAMEYRVDFINDKGLDDITKVKLTVKQRLQKPTIQEVASPSGKEKCWLVLSCSSADKGVTFTWHVKHPSVSFSSIREPDNIVLVACLKNIQNDFEITCTSSRNMENASSVFIQKHRDEKPQPQTQSPPQFTTSATSLTSASPSAQNRSRDCVAFFMGGILGGSLTVLIFIFRGRIKKAWEYLKGKLLPPKSSSQSS
uniref:CD48 antigen n=1 Tax=Scatophagus argus TaxID=75038 RepID=UPI001ED843FB|nr:CD48 antigen [Scatophagus argus]